MNKFPSKIFLITSGLVILFYLPILLYPSLLLSRHNDLQEFFWPIFFYTKQHLLADKSLPFWNNLFLSGVPLLPDPQSFLFYLPNIIFLFFPIGAAFIGSFFFHTLIGSLGCYFCAKKLLKLSSWPALFTTFLYIFSPKIAGYLEAGHFGLVVSFGWLPWIIFATVSTAKSPNFLWSLLLALSLAGVFYTHSVTFIIVLIFSILIFLTVLTLSKVRKIWKKSFLFFSIALLITFGLIAITLLPQIDWMPETTRFLLLENKEIFPKWVSKTEFIQTIFFPWLNGLEAFWSIDTEKWLSLGLIPSLLAFWGFLTLKRNLKLIIISLIILVFIIALSNASPFYFLLLSQKWYLLMRVATRVWFIPVFLVIFLSGKGFESLISKKVGRNFLIIIAILAISELMFLSWGRLFKPIPTTTKFAPEEVFRFLKEDQEHFRIFCINRCLSQQEAAKNNLELVEGYNTLLQKNYYQHMWQLSGGYWDYYTLALPPIGAYTYDKLQPDATSLGEYNTKYVISPHELTDQNFTLEKKLGDYLIYNNKALLPRAYFKDRTGQTNIEAPILIYQPNFIKVDVSKHISNQVILAEVYSKGWKAYLNGGKETPILQTPISLRLVNISSKTKFVYFRYEPDSFKIGRLITIFTILSIMGVLLVKLVQQKNIRKYFRKILS